MDTENLNKWWYSLPEEIRKNYMYRKVPMYGMTLTCRHGLPCSGIAG